MAVSRAWFKDGKLVLFIAGKPQPKERPRKGANGNIYTPRKTQKYEDLVKLMAHTQLRTPFKEDVCVRIEITYDKPKQPRHDFPWE
ncbi:MAG: RusA family crossover junction endodeoxyribonuclease, partial [Planctomycetes bacterium]|nr:RusA family crossover junction endodeoxyribonuclease [Planctomycetota bacterium]